MKQERLRRIQQLLDSMQAEMQAVLRGYLDDILVGSFDPRDFMNFMRGLNFDPSRFAGTARQSTVDPYKILGLDRSAGNEEIKNRYHRLLRNLHPDTSGTEGTSFLLELVMAAYETIKKERSLP